VPFRPDSRAGSGTVSRAMLTMWNRALPRDLWDTYEAAAAQTTIGSDSFVERMRRGLTNLQENINVRGESNEQRALAAWVSFEVCDALQDVAPLAGP